MQGLLCCSLSQIGGWGWGVRVLQRSDLGLSDHAQPEGMCLPIYSWVGPRPRAGAQGSGSEVQANPGSELEVRTGGQHGGGGLHLTRPPPPPSPVAPQGTQPHITRASPHLPATSPHSQPRHLACPPLPRTLRRAGGGGSGAGAHPRAGQRRQVPLPQRPFGPEVGRGPGRGVGRCPGASGGSLERLNWGESRPSGRRQPAPSPSSFPAAQPVPGAQARRGSPHSCAAPQLRGAGETSRSPRPHSAPVLILHLPAPLSPGRDSRRAVARGWTPGFDSTCSPRWFGGKSSLLLQHTCPPPI